MANEFEENLLQIRRVLALEVSDAALRFQHALMQDGHAVTDRLDLPQLMR